MILALGQVFAVAFGLIAAFFWWRSTVIGLRSTKDMPSGKSGGDGDMLIETASGFLEYRFSDQARANAIAALFSGLSVVAAPIAVTLHYFGMQ